MVNNDIKTSRKLLQKLDAEAVIKSLRVAIEMPYDYESAFVRLKSTINRLPSESLCIGHKGSYVSFSCKGRYLKKNSDLLYSLARKRYCKTLLNAMSLYVNHPPEHYKSYPSHKLKYEEALGQLTKLLRDFEAGNLEIARIVLTPKQYTWYTGYYQQKPFYSDTPYRGNNYGNKGNSSSVLTSKKGDPVRSKSEQGISDSLWELAALYHYEQQFKINVLPLVNKLEESLEESNQLNGNLFYIRNGVCSWNVPKQLEWMNASGSVWRTYNYRTGEITLYPDFTIMLADGSLLYLEHEGLLTDFTYRCNATERIALMRIAGGVSSDNIIETTEEDVADRNLIDHIIQTKILPRIWF